jgi:CBS domain-containing protein
MAFPLSAGQLRHRFERRSRRLELTRGVRESLVSVAGLIGRPVRQRDGTPVGRVADVVARWDSGGAYPPVTGLVVRVGSRRAFVAAAAVASIGQREVELATTWLDLRDFTRREGEAALAADVLDHQLIDIDGARVVRAADLYLSTVDGQPRLVGVDVGFASLFRRLGPARWRTRPTPEAVIDFASVHSFGAAAGRGGVRVAAHRTELNRLRPAELADLLEDLGRPHRRQLLDVVEQDTAADALEEMRPAKLHELLADTGLARAAELVARMEPDEAADALRDLGDEERAELLDTMPEPLADQLRQVLAYPPDCAGGVMTTVLATTHPADTLAKVRGRLAGLAEHLVDLDSVIVVDDDGRLVDDVSLGELWCADPAARVADLVGAPWPVTVGTNTPVREVADRLVEARRLSVVVVDEVDRPVGRILADDLLDALVSTRRRYPRTPQP